MKILNYADMHIAQHKRSMKRLEDCLNVQEWVLQTARDNKIDKVVFAGDLFQDREKIDIIAYHLTFDIISKYKDIHIYMLLGNHDLWYYEKWDIHSIRSFSALDNVTIIDKPCTIKIGNHNIDFLPYTNDPIKYFDQLNSKILFGHLAIDGAKLNTRFNTFSDVLIEHDGEMVKVNSSLFKKWDKVFLGHYHAAQKIDNIEYIGSPLELNWGESGQKKHIIIYDLNTGEQEYIINNFSPKHIFIDENNMTNLKNNFIKCNVKDPSNKDLKAIIEKISIHDPQSIEIIPIQNKENEHFIENAKSIMNDTDKMIEKFVELSNTNLKKDKLIKIGKQLCVLEKSNT